jgi:hypothetical protein
MNWVAILLGLIFIPIFILYCYQRGLQKKAGFTIVLLIMIFCTPFIGYWIVEALPNHKVPCKWCGNKSNEAKYCGVCNKNEAGELKPNV